MPKRPPVHQPNLPNTKKARNSKVHGASSWGRTHPPGWARTRLRVLVRDNYQCKKCGLIHHTNEVDHITPVAAGGSHDDSNLQTLCIECHKKKTAIESNAGRREFQT